MMLKVALFSLAGVSCSLLESVQAKYSYLVTDMQAETEPTDLNNCETTASLVSETLGTFAGCTAGPQETIYGVGAVSSSLAAHASSFALELTELENKMQASEEVLGLLAKLPAPPGAGPAFAATKEAVRLSRSTIVAPLRVELGDFVSQMAENGITQDAVARVVAGNENMAEAFLLAEYQLRKHVWPVFATDEFEASTSTCSEKSNTALVALNTELKQACGAGGEAEEFGGFLENLREIYDYAHSDAFSAFTLFFDTLHLTTDPFTQALSQEVCLTVPDPLDLVPQEQCTRARCPKYCRGWFGRYVCGTKSCNSCVTLYVPKMNQHCMSIGNVLSSGDSTLETLATSVLQATGLNLDESRLSLPGLSALPLHDVPSKPLQWDLPTLRTGFPCAVDTSASPTSAGTFCFELFAVSAAPVTFTGTNAGADADAAHAAAERVTNLLFGR